MLQIRACSTGFYWSATEIVTEGCRNGTGLVDIWLLVMFAAGISVTVLLVLYFLR